MLILLIFILFLLYYLWAIFILKDPYNNTVRDVLKVFKKNLSYCNAWGVKPRFNFFTLKIKEKAPDAIYTYNMKNGKGYYEDNDNDGCSVNPNQSYNFRIGKGKKGNLTILRSRD